MEIYLGCIDEDAIKAARDELSVSSEQGKWVGEFGLRGAEGEKRGRDLCVFRHVEGG